MFKEKFKYFKKKVHKPDYSTVLDIGTENHDSLTQVSAQFITVIF